MGRKKRGKGTGALTPTLEERRKAGLLKVTPATAVGKDEGREGLTPLDPSLPPSGAGVPKKLSKSGLVAQRKKAAKA